MKTKKILIYGMLGLLCMWSVSCQDYLDIVPDNVQTVDHSFKTRYEAEGFLYGIYGFLPNFPDPTSNPALMGGDEIWYAERMTLSVRLWNIARGFQSASAPLADYWSSVDNSKNYDLNGGIPVFTALRDCNIFLENIHKSVDLPDEERIRWIAEVKFLKAYFHFWLFRMYGPVPLIQENMPLNAPGDVYRAPVDEVVEYIVSLLDEAAADLPETIDDVMLELGRATQAIALAVKAQTLTLAASPLFNGNPDYASFTDSRGVHLFPTEYSPEKWRKAADALKAAIDAAHGQENEGHKLFDFKSETAYGNALDTKTVMAMQVRGAATVRWNKEIVWGSTFATNNLQRSCHPQFYLEQNTGGIYWGYSPTLRTVEQFYTKNGIPIEEDKDWVGVELYELTPGDAEHKLYIKEGYRTMNLHFNREARFYGSIMFDGGTYYGNGRILSDNNLWVTNYKNSDMGGGGHYPTGYGCKKLVCFMTSVPDNNSSVSVYNYSFPIIRLADLYLMYAEALNESMPSPGTEVYEYIDRVRARTGLEGVVESWSKYAIPEMAEKPLSQDGMREIIQRERMNELAFEGARFWDLRRWKLTKKYMNQPVRGLSIHENSVELFNEVQVLFPLTFSDKEYLWPIRLSVLMRNNNLVQNPGWN
ncbi:MAG: RagB/SusD family nutrient uptake outer membrane protein [Candidatus Ordinivivax streblomastigis]|uniref:RagB/SusD family nutrient uptake outer membrane protein n=1 Tax=Candidatus Ordinivivax streblomastigis TaxID=2540710 RepID=A0A5M8NXB2_9BACT|nr:MAG: RagB/SusD family nutrient uptake outer membrane protein [Candidatus Ordinivivax streblomastigis]